MPQDAFSDGYSVRDAAEALGLGQQTVYKKIRLGEIPADRTESGRLVIPRDYVRSQRAPKDVDATLSYIQKVLADAPPLTSEQRTRLAELLAPVRGVA